MPGPRRQVRRDPGHDEQHLVQGAGRRLRRALRRALRHPARADGRRRSTSCRARSTTRSSPSARANAGGPALGKEEWTGVCQKCHRLDHAYIGPALGGNPLLADREGHRDAAAQRRRARCRPSAATGRDAQIDALDRATRSSTRRRARVVAVNVETRPPVPRRLAPRPRHLVADDRRPQADRDPLHLHVARLLRDRRRARAADPHRSSRRRTSTFLTKNSYNEVVTIHGTTMIFLVIVPILAGLRELPRAADDRRARHGVPAPERALVLALPARRRSSCTSASSRRAARRRAGWTSYAPLSTLHSPGQRPGPLDPRPAHPLDRVARRRDQLRRDDPQHAHARDVVDAHPALRAGRWSPTAGCS